MQRRVIKNSTAIVIALLVIAFAIRFYAAVSVPLTLDEREYMDYANTVSFDSEQFTPIGDIHKARTKPDPFYIAEIGFLSIYVTKAGVTLFGYNKIGGRSLFIIFSLIGIFFIYKLVAEEVDKRTALLTLFLLVFSQYHIGESRLIDPTNLLLFFTSVSLYCFFKALHTTHKKWLYLTGVLLGIGYFAKVLIIFLLPVFAIYLWQEKQARHKFRPKDLSISLAIMSVPILLHLFCNLNHNLIKYRIENVTDVGLSMRTLYLYFAEIIAWFLERAPFIVYQGEDIYIKSTTGYRFLSGISTEFPVAHWVIGILIISGFLYYAKKSRRKNSLICFSFIMFSFIFIITSIIAGANSLFDDHWWGAQTIFPGIILCSAMLCSLIQKYRFVKLAIMGLMLYLIFHSVILINLPESEFAVPKKKYAVIH